MGEKSWVENMKEKLGKFNELEETQIWRKHSIYKVPTHIKDLKPKAFKPQVVSFGPYHHGEKQLKPMEKHKQRALLHFLKRTKKPIEDYAKAVEDVVTLLEDSYEQLDDSWKDRNKFLELMILDGCFMLEVLRTATEKPMFHDPSSDNYAEDDPIFSSHGRIYAMPYIRGDMLMIENQLPLLVLEKLVAVEREMYQDPERLNCLVMDFLVPKTQPSSMGLGFHVLDIFRKGMIQFPSHLGTHRRLCGLDEREGKFNGHSAMKLHNAGIRFKKSTTQSLIDITFHNGVLRLPVIIIDGATRSTFLNLMTFERLHVGIGNNVTSYVVFMGILIDSNKDVSLLQSKGIIQNTTGSDKAVMKLFKNLSKYVILDPDSSLAAVHREVNLYLEKKLNRKWKEWQANLVHTCFRSPWAFLSLAAAVLLLKKLLGRRFGFLDPLVRKKSD